MSNVKMLVGLLLLIGCGQHADPPRREATATENVATNQPPESTDASLSKQPAAAWETPAKLAEFAALSLHDDLVDINGLIELGEALAESGDEMQATIVFTKALERHRKLDYFISNLSDLFKISAGLRKAGNETAADAVLNEALKSAKANDVPDTRQRELLEVVVPLDRAGQREKAREILNEIFEGAKGDPEVSTYLLKDLARAFAKTGHRDRALEVAEMISDPDDKAYLLDDIVQGLADAGLHDAALGVAETIVDWLTKTSAIASVCESLADAGKFDRARTVAESIESVDYRVAALNHIAAAQAKQGHREEAIRLLDELIASDEPTEFKNYYDQTLMEMIKTLCNLGEIEKASNLLKYMDESELKAIAVKAIVRSFAQSGKAQQALELVPRIKHEPHRLTAVNVVAIDIAFAGDRKQARALLQQRLKFAEKIHRPGSKALVLSQIAE
ncbi:MAG: tetratricopeptide repeat protein, partial [Planctomycetaceae bacterium]